MRRSVGASVGILVLAVSSAAQAVVFYADGTQINLATGRSNVFSASKSVQYVPQAAAFPSWNNEFRTDPDISGNTYWQVDFPQAYNISGFHIETYEQPYRVSSVELLTSDGLTWASQGTFAAIGTAPRITATFASVSGVQAVRLRSVTWDNPTYRGIFRGIRITGPNSGLEVSSEFSLTQSTWAGGSVQSASGWDGYSGGAAPVIDDFTRSPFIYNGLIARTFAADPAPIDILLNSTYWIDTVAVAAGNEQGAGGRSTLSVDVYTSPDAAGSNWVLAKLNAPLTGNASAYYVIPLDARFFARRVRYDFSHSNNSSETFVSELFAFQVIPEPATFALLLAGAPLLLCRRRA